MVVSSDFESSDDDNCQREGDISSQIELGQSFVVLVQILHQRQFLGMKGMN